MGAALLPILAASLADSRVALSQCHVTAQAEFSLYSRLPHLPAGSGSLIASVPPVRTTPPPGAGQWAGKGTGGLKGGRPGSGLPPLALRYRLGPATAEDVPWSRVARCGRDSRGEAKGGTGDRGVRCSGLRAVSWLLLESSSPVSHVWWEDILADCRCRQSWLGRERWACLGVISSVGRGGGRASIEAPHPHPVNPTQLLRLMSVCPSPHRTRWVALSS